MAIHQNELYNLRWNSFTANLINVFNEQQTHENLVDVTLSSEGQFIKAHRLILSACSGYFQKVFETHTTPNMLIVLNEIKFKDLQLIIQFMYRGEVKVADLELQQFLAVGKMLQVKGLCSVEFKERKISHLKSDEKKPEQMTVSTPMDPLQPPSPPIEKANSSPKDVAKTRTSPLEPAILPKKRKLTPSTIRTSNQTETRPIIIKKKLTKADTVTPHIPRPPNAFMIFANQWRKKLAVEYPNESNKDISVRLGNMWKSLSQESKDAFYEDARKADEEHKVKYPGYYYSPREARSKKASTSKGIRPESVVDVELNEPLEDPIEIKVEENGND